VLRLGGVGWQQQLRGEAGLRRSSGKAWAAHRVNPRLLFLHLQAHTGSRALSEGCVLVLKDRTPIGCIEEIFGPGEAAVAAAVIVCLIWVAEQAGQRGVPICKGRALCHPAPPPPLILLEH
jgi:hypothetical protein